MITFILEFVFEIVIEGALEITGSKKVPMWIRVLLASVFLLIAGGGISLLICLGIVVCIKDSIIGGMALVVLGIFLAILMLYRIRCIYNGHKENQKINI